MSFLLGALITFAVAVYVETKNAETPGATSKLAGVGAWFKGLF